MYFCNFMARETACVDGAGATDWQVNVGEWAKGSMILGKDTIPISSTRTFTLSWFPKSLDRTCLCKLIQWSDP